MDTSKHKNSNFVSLRGIPNNNLLFLIYLFQSLFELELAGCNEVTEAGLWACLTPRIVSLSLADCINIADEAVGAVAQLLPSLYEFSLQVRWYRLHKHSFNLIFDPYFCWRGVTSIFRKSLLIFMQDFRFLKRLGLISSKCEFIITCHEMNFFSGLSCYGCRLRIFFT